MADVWAFENVRAEPSTVYADGTTVPHMHAFVTLNGKRVGEIECHMHRRKGRDGRLDMSFGSTHIVYSPPAGGN